MFDVTSIEVMVISMYVIRSLLIRYVAASRRGITQRNRAHG
jgi:hypothetical protein